MSLAGSIMCGAPRGCTHRGGARQCAHQRARAAGVIEVHVREEQEFHRVALDAAARASAASISGTARVGPGIDDGRAPAGHHDVRGIHLRADIFGVDGGDAVGELRQAWHDLHSWLAATYQHERKITPHNRHGRALVPVAHGAVEERGNLVLDNIPAGGHAADGAARRLPELAWCKFRRLAARRRLADRHALRRRRAVAPRGDAAGRARTTHVLSRAGDRGARRRNRPWRPGFVFLRDQGGNENAQVHYYDTTTRAVRMLTDGKGLNGGLVWSHDGKRVAFHSTARDGVSYDLFIAEPGNNLCRRAWCTTASRRTGRCWTGRPTTPNY